MPTCYVSPKIEEYFNTLVAKRCLFEFGLIIGQSGSVNTFVSVIKTPEEDGTYVPRLTIDLASICLIV